MMTSVSTVYSDGCKVFTTEGKTISHSRFLLADASLLAAEEA